jgi:hypothetical protein
MPEIATEMFFIAVFYHNMFLAPTGHPQVEHSISYLFMVLSVPQWIRCFVIA